MQSVVTQTKALVTQKNLGASHLLARAVNRHGDNDRSNAEDDNEARGNPDETSGREAKPLPHVTEDYMYTDRTGSDWMDGRMW